MTDYKELCERLQKCYEQAIENRDNYMAADLIEAISVIKEETSRRYQAECNYDKWYHDGTKAMAENECLKEDTCLSPEEITELKKSVEEIRRQAFVKMLEAKGIVCVDDGIKHMEELLDAEAEGRLMVLPCKIGDTVWYRYMVCDTPYRKTHCDDHEGSCDTCPHRHPVAVKKMFGYTDIPLVGSNIFLTHETAIMNGGTE